MSAPRFHCSVALPRDGVGGIVALPDADYDRAWSRFMKAECLFKANKYAEALPAFAFISLLFKIPESPKWLVQAGREDEARRTLEYLQRMDELAELNAPSATDAPRAVP